MGKKDKKKGSGAAKTAAKTEKKANLKLKKELVAKGEVSIPDVYFIHPHYITYQECHTLNMTSNS